MNDLHRNSSALTEGDLWTWDAEIPFGADKTIESVGGMAKVILSEGFAPQLSDRREAQVAL